jgi:hypothetical protein
MSLEPVTNHVESGLSKLLEQYQGKPRLEAWIRSYLLEVQKFSDEAWNVLVSRLIDEAIGEQLTVLSRLVGETTRLENDERQRVLVRSRIAVNRSRGRGDDVLRVASLLLAREYSLNEFFPGAMVLTVEEAIDFIPELEHRMLEQSAAGGIRVDVHFSADPESTWFRFGSGPGWGEGVWIGAVSEH